MIKRSKIICRVSSTATAVARVAAATAPLMPPILLSCLSCHISASLSPSCVCSVISRVSRLSPSLALHSISRDRVTQERQRRPSGSSGSRFRLGKQVASVCVFDGRSGEYFRLPLPLCCREQVKHVASTQKVRRRRRRRLGYNEMTVARRLSDRLASRRDRLQGKVASQQLQA